MVEVIHQGAGLGRRSNSGRRTKARSHQDLDPHPAEPRQPGAPLTLVWWSACDVRSRHLEVRRPGRSCDQSEWQFRLKRAPSIFTTWPSTWPEDEARALVAHLKHAIEHDSFPLRAAARPAQARSASASARIPQHTVLLQYGPQPGATSAVSRERSARRAKPLFAGFRSRRRSKSARARIRRSASIFRFREERCRPRGRGIDRPLLRPVGPIAQGWPRNRWRPEPRRLGRVGPQPDRGHGVGQGEGSWHGAAPCFKPTGACWFVRRCGRGSNLCSISTPRTPCGRHWTKVEGASNMKFSSRRPERPQNSPHYFFGASTLAPEKHAGPVRHHQILREPLRYSAFNFGRKFIIECPQLLAWAGAAWTFPPYRF